jgi:hypothetical protein
MLYSGKYDTTKLSLLLNSLFRHLRYAAPVTSQQYLQEITTDESFHRNAYKSLQQLKHAEIHDKESP